MSGQRYRVAINGFWCRNETWDDALNWDGKHDEVFLSVNTKVVTPQGEVLQNLDSESDLMGDTWRLPGRVQVGSASDRGGIVSGDRYPMTSPWQRTGSVNTQFRVPPYVIWEGELDQGGEMVFLTPTIWEWDPGAGFFDGWLDWQVKADQQFGQRAKEIFGKIWPVATPIFDAVSLGIQTVGTLAGLWSPLGKSMRRPIGLQRDPADPNGAIFNPAIIALSAETAEYLATSNLQGYGSGIVELRYTDDPYMRGVYSIFLQVERLPEDGADWRDAGHANDVVAMTAMDGRLYAATGDNSLWQRDAVTNEIPWTRIGHATDVTAIAATGGRLFCATRDNRLWTREATPVEMDWTPIGEANAVVGMTALDGSLFCATSDNKLWVRPPVLTDINWSYIGQANDLRALAAGSGNLYGVSTDAGLHRRPPVLADTNWQLVGSAPQSRAMAASGQRLFIATTGSRLLHRALP